MMFRLLGDMLQFMTVLPRGILNGARIRSYVEECTGKKNIAEAPLPLGVVAVDLNSGKRVVFTNRPPAGVMSGTIFVQDVPLGLAVQASTAIPGVFEPVAFRGMLLVDGGVAEAVPVPLARQMGARTVTAVNLIESNTVIEPQGIVQVILRSANVITQQAALRDLAAADLVIHPPVVQADLGDFSHAMELIEGGRRAMLDALPALHDLVR